MLNDLGRRVKQGETLVPRIELSVGNFPPIIPEEVPNPGDIVLGANRFYQRPDEASVPVLQLTYADQSGRFPWSAEYRGELQPRPGSFTA